MSTGPGSLSPVFDDDSDTEQSHQVGFETHDLRPMVRPSAPAPPLDKGASEGVEKMGPASRQTAESQEQATVVFGNTALPLDVSIGLNTNQHHSTPVLGPLPAEPSTLLDESMLPCEPTLPCAHSHSQHQP